MLTPSLRRILLPCTLAAILEGTLLAPSILLAQPAAGEPAARSCATMRPLLPEGAEPLPHCLARVEVFADGNVKDVLGGGTASANASGALGLHYTGSRYDVTGLVNIAGSADTVRRQFGSAVLIPAAGTALNAAAISIRARLADWGSPRCTRYDYPMICNIGIRLHADASTRLWATRTELVPSPDLSDTVERVAETMEVPTWGAGLNVFYTFFVGDIPTSDSVSRPVEMLIDVGVLRRTIRGDMAADNDGRRDLRQRLLGSDRTEFDGFQVGLTLVYHQIRSSFSYVRLNGDVDGLSRGQIVAMVDLRATLASGLLRRN